MNLREFVRFTYQHRIIPVLIERPDDSVKLFKHSVKGQSGGEVNLLLLNFDGFKQSLVRIAVFAQDQLGGQNEDLLTERMRRETNEANEERKKKDKIMKQMDSKSKADS